MHLQSTLALSQEIFGGVDRAMGGVWGPVEEKRTSLSRFFLNEFQCLLDVQLCKIGLPRGPINLELFIIPGNIIIVESCIVNHKNMLLKHMTMTELPKEQNCRLRPFGRTAVKNGPPLPACHAQVLVDRDVGSALVIVGPKMAVGRTEPFVKTMFEWVELWLLTQVPV